MQARHPTRRFMLLLPLAVAACGGPDETVAFAPLRYDDLPPIRLKVASIAIEQRFIPAGVPPDVSNLDPAAPVEALKTMARDRLQTFGLTGKAVFAALNASLTREDDVLSGTFAVSLTIIDDNGTQLGFAQAQVQRRRSGPIDDIRPALYDMTKALMSDMNVEFEYQIRRHLRAWVTDDAAPDTSVQQAPLDGSPQPPPQSSQIPPSEPAPVAAPTPEPQNAPAYPPTYLQPPGQPAPAPYTPAPVPQNAPAYPPTYLQPPAQPAPAPYAAPYAAPPVPQNAPAYPPIYLQPH